MSSPISEWSAKISAWRQSGLTVAAWCRTNSVSYYRRLAPNIRQHVVRKLVGLAPDGCPEGASFPARSRGKSLATYLGNYLNHSDARLDNSVAERSVRPIALGRNNWMFVGSEDGGKAAAIILSLVQTCRNLKINPEEYMEDVLRRIMSHPAKRIDELLPDNWLAARMGQPAPPQEVAAKMV